MKRILAALALSTAVATGAFAQGTGGGAAGGANDANANTATGAIAPRGAAVTMDEQTRIRTYWRSARPAGVTVSGIVVGESVPDTVELRTFPDEVAVSNYRYVVVGDNMYLVEPSTRRVVYMMQ
jgi:hypothetical protein